MKAGQSFSAAHVVGYFDTIEEMHRVYARYKGHTALTADASGWRLVKQIDTAFGFELGGDPTTPGYRDQLTRRIRHVLETYPELHTLCLWEVEGMGVYGWPHFAASPGCPTLHRQYANHFRYLAHVPNRQAEGVRLATLFNWTSRRSAGWMACSSSWAPSAVHATPSESCSACAAGSLRGNSKHPMPAGYWRRSISKPGRPGRNSATQ